MTALPLHHTAAPAAPACGGRGGWVPLDEAAKLMGKSEGHLRRLCKRLAERGLARKLGSGMWHLSTAASPRLTRAPIERTESGTSIVNELLKSASVGKRAEAEKRANVVIEFRRFKVRDGVVLKRDLPSFLAATSQRHGLDIGRSTLYGWEKRCPTSADFAGCVAALLDTRGRPRTGTTKVSDAAWECFCSLYLTTNQLSIKHCYEMTRTRADDEGWGWPSLSRVRQLVRERLDQSTITLRREGAESWSRDHLAPMGQATEAWEAGQCWEGDHTPFDFSVRVFRAGQWRVVRPQLTAWLDRRTRRLMGWQVCEQGNQGSIRLALLDALPRDGVSVPEVVWIDNGKDFMAASVGGLTKSERRGMTRAEKTEAESRATGILRMIGIEPHFALPYNHNGKARIERFFGTVHARFDRLFATWCGSRPGMVERKTLNAKLKEVLSLPTLDELAEQFAEWAEWYNHRADHNIDELVDRETGEQLSPIEFYQRFLPVKRTIDLSLLPLLGQTWSRPLKVYKHGVSIKIAGRVVRFGEMQPALEPLVGSNARVFVSFDPADTTRVEIWDKDFRHLCSAPENGRYGGLVNDAVTADDRREAHRQRKEQTRRARQRVDVVTLSLSDAELASRATRDREIAETQARLKKGGHDDPPPMRLVQTPLDGKTPIEPEPIRQAVGAECHDIPTIAEALAMRYDKSHHAHRDEAIADDANLGSVLSMFGSESELDRIDDDDDTTSCLDRFMEEDGQ